MFPRTLTTERLLLERLCHDTVDVSEFYRVRSTDEGIEDVTRYLPWDPHETPKETAELLDRIEREWETGEAARYAVRPKASEPNGGELAGVTKLEVDWVRRTGSLGIWLRKRYWGRGYSGERAGVLLELAFDRLDLAVVEVIHQDGNEKSRRAIEGYIDEYGGGYDGRLQNWRAHGSDVVDAHRYTITADEYEDAAGAKY